MKLYFGIVEDNNDPLKAGRYRVRVKFVHSEDKSKIPTDKLYWSTCMMSCDSSSINGIGKTPNLIIGSHVIGTFLDGYKQQFIILGSFYGLNGDIPTPALANYPNNEVTVSETGHSLQFNNSTNEVILSANSGSNVNLNSNVGIKSVGNTNINSDASLNLSTTGNFNSISNGQTIISSSGATNISSGSELNLTAPSIKLNSSFSFARPSFIDLQPVTVKTRTPIIGIPEVNSGVSFKDDLIVEEEQGNICSLEEPTNLYDTSLSDVDVDWNDDKIKVLFEELGIDTSIYDSDIYWGVVWLAMALKRSGYKYLKSAIAKDYIKYENPSDLKTELSTTTVEKGDVIIFTRNDSMFVGVYSGVYEQENNSYTCIVPDYEDRIENVALIVDENITIKRIFRPRTCNDNKIVYNGKCELPNIRTGYIINDDLMALALNIYHESRSETRIFDGEQYPRGQVAVAWCVKNRLKLVKEFGSTYVQFNQGFKRGSSPNPKTIAGVVFARTQFSWTLPYRLNSKGNSVGGISNWTPTTKKSWCLALEIANAVINEEVPDPTDLNNNGLGNIFYFAPRGMLALKDNRTDKPNWYNTYVKYGYRVLRIENQVYMIPPTTRPRI